MSGGGQQRHQFEEELFAALREASTTMKTRGGLLRSMEEFVLEYGWWFRRLPLPSSIVRGEPGQCHKNAADLAASDSRLIYCEGFALARSGLPLTRHSWVTDGTGAALDNTWESHGIAYAGVPFQTCFVNETNCRNKASISLLDNWKEDWPLCRELGSSPSKWYEPRGRGCSQLNDAVVMDLPTK